MTTSRRFGIFARALCGRLRAEAGIGLVEAVIAMSLFLVAGTALADVLSSSATSHGFTMDQTLGQQAADAQIENVRALPYDSVGTTGGNPPGSVAPTEPVSAVGVTGIAATITTSIHFVGDGVPDGYNSTTNYKQVVVSVTRDIDGRNLATESTYIAPPTRAPYGGISQVAIGVIVTDIGDNEPVPGVAIALQTGPSAPRSDTTDTNGGVLFAGMTANPATGPTAYYNVVPTLPAGYVEMAGDVKQAQLGPGQITNLSIRVYQPATIYVHLTSGGSNYTGNATVTVTPKSGTPQNYSVGGDPGGSYSITGINPNAEYTVTASNAGGPDLQGGRPVRPEQLPHRPHLVVRARSDRPDRDALGDGCERQHSDRRCLDHGYRRPERHPRHRDDRRDRRSELPVRPRREPRRTRSRGPTGPRPSSRPASPSQPTSRPR